MRPLMWFFALLLATCPTSPAASPAAPKSVEIDLQRLWDDRLPLENPHKGWYHHFPDNHINKYVIQKDSDLIDFPGMDHLYIRLSWAYLEPAEGKFDWSVIDRLIEKWTAHGLGISFRISCKETSTDRVEQQFATPRWVMEAGAKGGHFRMGQPAGPEAPWEPDFADPVFLRKLEAFLQAFAARYDGKPWLRYVDVGSIGDWGEGHTWAGSRKNYGEEIRRVHIDLHLKYFKQTQLIVSDDFVFETGGAEERQRLHRYVLEHGIGYRDDSILVDGYFAGHSRTATVRSPEFFADAFLKVPTVLELEHYSAVKRGGNWLATPGSSLAKHGGGKDGAQMLREALGLLHATYLGYHGDAADWLRDNPELTKELLNRCGYWYFPHRITLPADLQSGLTNELQVTWENRGVAPAYEPFQLLLRLDGPRRHDATLDAGNLRWNPGLQAHAVYQAHLPTGFSPGSYTLKLKLYSPKARRDVLLPLKAALQDSDNYYALGPVTIR